MKIVLPKTTRTSPATGQRSNHRLVFIMVIIALGAALLLPGAVSADMGPKPTIKIVVKNAPAETYYLDLLVHENSAHRNLEGNPGQYDAAKFALLENYNQDGWYPALVHGTGMPLFGDLTGQKQGADLVHTFSYFGTPEQFKIIIVTPENQLVVSRELTRQTFNLTLTYDYRTGSINERSMIMAYIIQILSTLLPTLLIEGLLLILFKFPLRQNFWPFLLVNLATQFLMTAILGTAAISQGMFTAFLLLIPVEFLIILIESLAYAFLLKPHRKARRVGYAILANLISAAVGMIVMSFSFV